MSTSISLLQKQIKLINSKSIQNIDFKTGDISYSEKLLQHRIVKKISGDEELVRAYVLSKFTGDLGYREEDIEIEKEYNVKVGRDTKKPRVDLILKNKGGNDIFLFIELKAPDKFETDKQFIEGQLFGLAQAESKKSKIHYLVYYATKIEDDEIRDNCIIIDFQKYLTYESWEKDGSPSFGDELPARYNKPLKKPYIKNGLKDLITNIKREELTSLKTNLHNVLWGGGGTTDSEIFYALVNIILAKIQDEYSTNDGEEYKFQIFKYGEDEIEDPEDTFKRISKLYKDALEKRLNISGEELEDMRLINRKKFPVNKLIFTVQELEKYSFTEGKDSVQNVDLLGEFFEGIIREGFKQDKGQFFTPGNIITFIFYGLHYDTLATNLINNEKRLPYLIDPSSGSGTFLIESMKLLTKEIKGRQKLKLKKNMDVELFLNNNFPHFKENHWAEEYIYGVEINPDLGTSIKVNMILHGDGNSNIFVQDGLSKFSEYQKTSGVNHLQNSDLENHYGNNRVNGKFDIILSNPPFSVSLDKNTQRNLENNFMFSEKKNSENLFIERYYQLLRPGGRMGIVLPESVFDTTENKYIRLFIYKYFIVKSVVSLPQVTFEPYTSTKTSILFAQKKTQSEIETWENTWMKYAQIFSQLRTSVNDYVKYFVNEEKVSKTWAKYVLEKIENDYEAAIRKDIEYFLKDFIEPEDIELSIKSLLEKYSDEVSDLSGFDKTLVGNLVSDYRENEWWVFGEVTKELSYPIFMAEVENVGYKRTKRGEKSAPNELYRTDKEGNIILDDGIEETALDYLRKIEW